MNNRLTCPSVRSATMMIALGLLPNVIATQQVSAQTSNLESRVEHPVQSQPTAQPGLPLAQFPQYQEDFFLKFREKYGSDVSPPDIAEVSLRITRRALPLFTSPSTDQLLSSLQEKLEEFQATLPPSLKIREYQVVGVKPGQPVDNLSVDVDEKIPIYVAGSLQAWYHYSWNQDSLTTTEHLSGQGPMSSSTFTEQPVFIAFNPESPREFQLFDLEHALYAEYLHSVVARTTADYHKRVKYDPKEVLKILHYEEGVVHAGVFAYQAQQGQTTLVDKSFSRFRGREPYQFVEPYYLGLIDPQLRGLPLARHLLPLYAYHKGAFNFLAMGKDGIVPFGIGVRQGLIK